MKYLQNESFCSISVHKIVIISIQSSLNPSFFTVSLFIETQVLQTMRYLIFPLLLTILSSCDPTVVFREPQPQGKRDLSKFPDKFTGFYMASDDSSLYLIKSTIILEKYVEELADATKPMVNLSAMDDDEWKEVAGFVERGEIEKI